MPATIKQNQMRNPLQKLLPVFREKLEERGYRSLRGFALTYLTEQGEKTDTEAVDRFTARLHKYLTGKNEPSVTAAAWLSDMLGISMVDIAQAFNEVKTEKASQTPNQSVRLSACSISEKRMYNLHFLTEAS